MAAAGLPVRSIGFYKVNMPRRPQSIGRSERSRIAMHYCKRCVYPGQRQARNRLRRGRHLLRLPDVRAQDDFPWTKSIGRAAPRRLKEMLAEYSARQRAKNNPVRLHHSGIGRQGQPLPDVAHSQGVRAQSAARRPTITPSIRRSAFAISPIWSRSSIATWCASRRRLAPRCAWRSTCCSEGRRRHLALPCRHHDLSDPARPCNTTCR